VGNKGHKEMNKNVTRYCCGLKTGKASFVLPTTLHIFTRYQTHIIAIATPHHWHLGSINVLMLCC